MSVDINAVASQILTFFSSSLISLHRAAARTLCLVVSLSPPKTLSLHSGLSRTAFRNIKYALSGFFGAFGSFRFDLRERPSLRWAVR
jgi:hypothetical protein